MTPMNILKEQFKPLGVLTRLELHKFELEAQNSEYEFMRVYHNKREADCKDDFAFAFNDYKEDIANTTVTVSTELNGKQVLKMLTMNEIVD